MHLWKKAQTSWFALFFIRFRREEKQKVSKAADPVPVYATFSPIIPATPSR